MRSRAVGIVVAVIAVVAVLTSGLVLADPAADTGGQTASTATSNTTIAIQLRPGGDARVRVSTRFVLDDVNETAAFRGLGREFEAGNAGISVSTFRRAANSSSAAIGRSMNVTNVTRNATIVGDDTDPIAVGRLTLGFTWTSFARTEGDRLIVGDAFNGTHGTWLPGLMANQTLRIESPAGYAITRSPTGITNGTALFEGPTTFESGSPTVWFERRTGPTTPDRTTPDGGVFGFFGSLPPAVIGTGSLVIVVGVAVGAYVLLGRDDDDVADDRPAGSEARTADPSGSDGSSGSDDSATVVSPPDTTAGELLSDEERVERLLAANGGRMKQASIVEETGWSNAKVSQLLSAMDENDRVDKLRIGRENLISLPGEE